jgi:hypothetical protein
MLPHRYPTDGRRMIDIEIRGTAYRDHEPDFWTVHRESLVGSSR